MKPMNLKQSLPLLVLILVSAGAIYGQIYRYYSPGSIWTVTTIKIRPGMDPAYLEYLDGPFKRESDAMVQAGFLKSYKILRTLDDDASWNLLILREFASLADMERNEERADAKAREIAGSDQQQMKGYEDRSRIREVLGTKTARELRLK